MTPDEARTRIRDGLPVTLIRRAFYEIIYTGFGGGIRINEVVGLFAGQPLALAIAAAMPGIGRMERVFYMELTNPDEAEPRVPVYMRNLKSDQIFQNLENVESSLLGPLIAGMQVEEAAAMMTRLLPKLGLTSVDGQSAALPDPGGELP